MGVKRFSARQQQRRLRQWVQKELDRIEAEYNATKNANEALQDLSILVRRVVMSHFPRGDVAGLCGEKWETWLRDSKIGKGLDEQYVRLLVDGPYKKDIATDVIALLRGCRQWIESVMKSPYTKRATT